MFKWQAGRNMLLGCILYISVHNEASVQAHGLDQIGFSSDSPLSRSCTVVWHGTWRNRRSSLSTFIRNPVAISPSCFSHCGCSVQNQNALSGLPYTLLVLSVDCCKLKSSNVKRRPELRGRTAHKSEDYTGEQNSHTVEKGVFAELKEVGTDFY